uniref:Uncharacterized protein n=1 Tax=Avena sativa TaxID=4498 RepID=A0ACD5WXR3_AVESA
MASAPLKLSIALTYALLLSSSCHGLEVGYYKKSCPRVEAIVRDEVKKFVYKNANIGAVLSQLLRPGILRGFEVIDVAKDAVEKACPGVVSCADIVAFAGRDAAYFLSRLTVKINMPAGRRDGRISNFTEALANLPPPFFNITQLIASFAAKGLDTEDMVVLSGAHTIGVSHCSSFVSDRLAVPSDINAALANILRRQCPANPTPANDPTVNQDVVTPNALGNQYYKNVLAHKVLFTSDAALLTTPATTQMVLDNANIRGLWEEKFKKSMVKMDAIKVKTGYQGEIRRNCRVVNRS